MPELSRNRSHWERLKCGNGRRALDSSPHRFSKLVQPDVSSCWSMEQQRRLSPCRGGVSRTPGLGQAPFPGSYGWDVFHSIPHSTGAAGSGTDVSLPHLQASLQPLSRCCCSHRLSILLLQREGSAGSGLLPPILTMHRAALRCSHCPQALHWEVTRPHCSSHLSLCQAGSHLPIPSAVLEQLSLNTPFSTEPFQSSLQHQQI